MTPRCHCSRPSPKTALCCHTWSGLRSPVGFRLPIDAAREAKRGLSLQAQRSAASITKDGSVSERIARPNAKNLSDDALARDCPMPMEVIAAKVFLSLILPPGSLVLGLAVGSGLILAGYRRAATAIVMLGALQTLLMSIAPVSNGLMGGLESEARAAAASAPICCYEAILLLAGSVAPAYPPERMEPHLKIGADRVLEAARLYSKGVAPRIIVSGSRLPGYEQSEPDATRLLLIELGVRPKDIILDDTPHNTLESFDAAASLVHGGSIALVTSAFHMPRALRIARAAKLKVEAFPTDFQAVGEPISPWSYFNLINLIRAQKAIKEYLALAFDWRAVGHR